MIGRATCRGELSADEPFIKSDSFKVLDRVDAKLRLSCATVIGPAIKDKFLDFYVEFDVEIPDALFDVTPPLPVEELLRKSP